MRISDWSSDVCSSDLVGGARDVARRYAAAAPEGARAIETQRARRRRPHPRAHRGGGQGFDRAPDEAAGERRGDDARRAAAGRRALLAARDREEGAARIRGVGYRRRGGGRSRPRREDGARAADQRQGGRAARRSVRGAQFLADRSEEHTSELQSLMRISYAVFCLKKKKKKKVKRVVYRDDINS